MKPLGSSDPLLPGLVFDGSEVGEPRVVELQVKRIMRRPAAAAMKRPAGPLKRPSAAKIQKRPAAAAAPAEEPPQDDGEAEVDEDEEPEEGGLPGDNGDEDGPPEDED
eukprot:7662402-Pyramimonas_sp.AAC.1